MSHSGFLTLLGLTGNRNPKSEGPAIAGGLRDLVMEQHRTLFYTVRFLDDNQDFDDDGDIGEVEDDGDDLNSASQSNSPRGRETATNGSDPERKNSQVAMCNLIEQVSVSDQPD